MASDPEPRFLEQLLAHICAEQGIQATLPAPAGVEVTQRTKDGQTHTFILNHNADGVRVDLGASSGRDLLSGKELSGEVHIPGRDLLILRTGA